MRAYKEKVEAEETLRIRTALRDSSHFGKSSGTIQEKLESSHQEAEAALATATDEYDVLFEEFNASDFWPIPLARDLPEGAHEGLRHYMWQLELKVRKIMQQVPALLAAAGAGAPLSASASEGVAGDEDVNMELEATPTEAVESAVPAEDDETVRSSSWDRHPSDIYPPLEDGEDHA